MEDKNNSHLRSLLGGLLQLKRWKCVEGEQSLCIMASAIIALSAIIGPLQMEKMTHAVHVII